MNHNLRPYNQFFLLALSLCCLALVSCQQKEEKAPTKAQFNEQELELMALQVSEANAQELFNAASELDSYLEAKSALLQDSEAQKNDQRIFQATQKMIRIERLLAHSKLEESAQAALIQEQEKLKATLEKAEANFAPMQAKLDTLIAKRTDYLAALSKKLEQNPQAKNTIKTLFTASKALNHRKEKLEKLHAILQKFKNSKNLQIKDLYSDAKATIPAISQKESVLETRDTVARELNRQIVELHAIWSIVQIEEKPLFQTIIENTITPFVPFSKPSDLNMIRSYEPLSSGKEHETFLKAISWFALRIPDGQVAEAIRNKKDQKLLKRLGKENGKGLAEKKVVQLIINDMKATYGELEPTQSFRKSMVALYAEKTDLFFPHPAAFLIALFGTIILFGGLALAVFRAASSKKSVEVGPTT